MTLRKLAPFAAALGVLAVACCGGRLLTYEPRAARIERRIAAAERSPRPRPVARAETAPPIAAPKPTAKPAPPPEKPDTELSLLLRGLEPEERKELRDLVREERWADTEAKLADYAETAGWNEALTEEVGIILGDTHTGVSELLLRVDAGELSWDELKPELRDFRLVQGNRLRDVLGDPGFLAFAEGMDFWHPPENRPAHPGR